MDKDFKIIAITPERLFPGEAERIVEILSTGQAMYVHIRKPGCTDHMVASLIRSIPENFHDRLRLHDCFGLLSHFRLGGVHLNSRNPFPPDEAVNISKSCHSLEDLKESHHYDYVTLSPVFDSISKPGYDSAFSLPDLRPILQEYGNVIALGGVTPSKFAVLKEAGFAGAALLGHFFPPLTFENN